MTLPQITLDPPALKLALSIVGGLLLISMVRIMFLLRTNKRLREATEKMEKQVLAQHNQILSVKQDSNAWRGEIQRMFDAFRAEYSKRLEESEQRYQQIQQLAEKPLAAAKLPPPPPSAFITAPVKEESVAPVPALSIS
jgi:CHASE3 domain sensor protein